jgi:hypothetical protein
MTSREEFDRAMAGAATLSDRIAALGALLARDTGEEAIIVGGSAIYLHAPALAPSLDIDIVTSSSSAARVIEAWGFVRRRRRVWRREDLQIDVDLLRNFNGSRRRARTIVTAYGPVRVAGIEDLLIKRLVELKHWPTTPTWREVLVRQIQVLLAEYSRDMDRGYLSDRARREDVVDILLDFQARM